MRWPWEPKAEAGAVEDRNYSDAITEAIINASADSAASGYVAALEVAAGHLSRAFAAGLVTGSNAALFPPDVMARIGRSLVEVGEAVWYRVGRMLYYADAYTILPNGRYDISGPRPAQVRPENVLHARWNVDSATGRGISPLGAAQTLRDMQRRLEGALRDESGAATGYLLPVGSDGQAANIASLKDDINELKGRIGVIETARTWTGSPSDAPRREFELIRLGPNTPLAVVNLYEAAHRHVLAACGLPIQLATDSDGTAQREAWRRYLHGTVAPLGRLVTTAAARAGVPFDLDWSQLFASDISGRARAFQSLVGGGMSIEAAAAASGLLDTED